MDRDVVAPMTKLKARNAWGLSPVRDDKQLEDSSNYKDGKDEICRKSSDAVSPDLLGVVSKTNRTSGSSSEETKCRCCPYGYHIDLDFVRYCESLTSGDYLRQLKQLHRNRRRQRKSIEALLGHQRQCGSYNRVNDGLSRSQVASRHKRSGSVPPFLDTSSVSTVADGSSHPPPPDLVNNGDSLMDAMLDFEEAYKTSSGYATNIKEASFEKYARPSMGSRRKLPDRLDLAPIDLLHNAHNVSVSSSSEGSSPSSYGGCLMLSPLMLRRSDSIGSLSTISCSTTATEAPSVCSSVVVLPPPPPPSKHMADTMQVLTSHCSMGTMRSSSEETLNSHDGEALSPSCSSSAVSISPVVLQSIRDQMAISLNRMKELEEHAKAVPVLQVKLSVLKEEKRLLMLQLKAKAAKLEQRSLDDKLITLMENSTPPTSPSRVKTRTMSVNCAVITRSLGVGNSLPERKSVAVDNCVDDLVEKCSDCERRNSKSSYTVSRAVNTDRPPLLTNGSCDPISVEAPCEPPPCSKCIQMSLKIHRMASVDTDDLIKYVDGGTSPMIPNVDVVTHSTAVQAFPYSRSICVQTNPDTPKVTREKQVGCTVDMKHFGVNVKLEPVVLKRDFGVGDALLTSTDCEVCLKSHLEKKLKKIDLRTVGVGTHGLKDPVFCDKCITRNSVRTSNVGIVTENLKVKTRSVGSGTSSIVDLLCDRCTNLVTASTSTSTADLVPDSPMPSPTIERPVKLCDKCSADISNVAGNLVGEVSRSIVLPPIVEGPVRRMGAAKEFRKRRPPPMEFYINRDGYNEAAKKNIKMKGAIKNKTPTDTTVIGSSTNDPLPPSKSSSSGSDSSDDDEGESPDEASYDSVHGVIVHSCQDDEAIRQGVPGAVMFQPIRDSSSSPRQKHELSAAMRKACNVLDEHIRQPTSVSSKDLNASLNTIRHEWFCISSQKDTNQHVVDDYLDAFESISHAVLAKIVNQTDGSGNTAMHYAISYANWDVVSLLLDSKVCDVSRANNAGYTCLMLASLANIKHESYASVLEQLFKLGDINARATQHGQTALMLAASHGKVEMVRLLLEAGADMNIRDDDGSTALMCASEHGHLGVVRQLLSNVDCDASLADNDGSTALSIAMEAGHKDVGLMIYAATSLSRGSSPYASLRLKRRCQVTTTTRRTSTPPPRTPPPPSPAWSRKSTSSIP